MRIFPLITAAIVTISLFLLVFEREKLLAFAAGEPSPESSTDAAATPAPVEEPAKAERKVSVLVQRSKVQPVDSAILARGRTEAARQVEVKSETSGLVVSEPLRRGAYVTKDQPLCVLDVGTRDAQLKEAESRLMEAKSRLPEAQSRLVEAQARLAEAEINARAASQLSQDGFASETRVAATTAAVESARAGVSSAESGVSAATSGIRSAEAAVEAAERELKRLTLVAPFGGLLETDTAELGALLQPGAACATVIQLDPIKLVGFLAETDVDKVSVGAMAQARLASGREALGRVTFLSRSADPLTRTFRVEVTVANDGLNIRDGQTAELMIATEGKPAHLLPASALTLDDEGRLGLRIVNGDSRAEFVPVTLIRDTVDGVWLTGLPDAADVIVVGQEFVTEGVAVTVTYKEQAQ
ncbi:efflux RND transporter periplasmic adaptor subunit [Pseudorhodobacter sp. E13]|uniref:efflux RND transporter periplasmic adaptor subunit n=1 Tax=Pseudorhodobacter sp. E13 TaxID=2487931 RepID=UPI000F8F65E2|nr:efflux RND transporter periplasmic adaptor subunit [Pseudorhodobacter sp. E13]RUS60609.1 efflux RND transporter periplasmic adaptor subunit [Pseudorhodobacter sp. E13]